MPVIVPPFVQYQAPLTPLRGLWHQRPKEGDRFINAEINWLVTTKAGNAVQFELSGNSPVAFSQIVALCVDNSHCSVATTFLFPDSGFELVVPPYNQGLYPVITNALMFYAFATGAVVGDRTILQVLNSMPPPLSVQPFLAPAPAAQQSAISSLINFVNGATQIIAPAISGTLTGFAINVSATATASQGGGNLFLQDGSVKTLWTTQVAVAASQSINVPYNVSGLNLKFVNGVTFNILNATNIASGFVYVNLYYTVP